MEMRSFFFLRQTSAALCELHEDEINVVTHPSNVSRTK